MNELLDSKVAESQGQFTREQIEDFLWPRYKEYRLERKRAESLAVAQSALKK